MERALGVAIGLGATYLFLSVVVLALVEALATLLSKRSKALRECLEAVFEADTGGRGTSFLDRLLASPLLSTLGKATGAAHKVPSHIPTPLFVTAFLAALGSARGKGEAVAATYREALAALPEREQAVVRGIVGEAVDSVEEAERRVSLWFDALMTQLSEKYRRNTQWVTRGITAAVVLAVNANALTMGATFWRDSVVREAAVQLAERELALCVLSGGAPEVSKVPTAVGTPSVGGAPSLPAPSTGGAPSLPAPSLPAPSVGGAPSLPAPSVGGAPSLPAPAASGTVPLDCKKLMLETAESVPLPLGWTAQSWHAAWASPGAALSALLGLLLSFVAVCLGAPFWFDILRRITPLVRAPAMPPAPPPVATNERDAAR